MGSFVFFPFISVKYQDITIEGLIKFYNQGLDIAIDFLKISAVNITKNRALQFIFMTVLQLAFGLTKGGLFSLLNSEHAEKIRAYLSQLENDFPGESTASVRMGQVRELCEEKVMALAGAFLDDFYDTIGKWARGTFSEKYRTSCTEMTPPPECFLGLIPPSKLFPSLDVEQRGIVMPYFNALIYQHARRITNTSELIGLLKTPSFESETMVFPLAAKLGFFGGAPGKNEIYRQFKTLEQKAEPCNTLLNELLANLEIIDLNTVSVDSTNVPVDKRDKTGSIGTGSRGTFFGHKASIGCDANCIPLNSTLDTGYCSDVTLYPDTINPIKDFANRTGQVIWSIVMDAAYSNLTVISHVESIDAVPVVDINPKNSILLKELKKKGSGLLELARKALKSASREEKRKWRRVLRELTKKKGTSIPLKQKESILRALLTLIGRDILRKGLSAGELQAAEQLRTEVMSLRRKIRTSGTTYEKKVGLSALLYGSIEWLLVYSIRGQNEGINGILKKRGNLIGDGQHTSWLIGCDNLSARQVMEDVGIKYMACVKFLVTGQTDHFLRFLHNWRHDKSFFCITILIIFCR